MLRGGEVAPSGHARHASLALAPENVPLAHGAQALVEFVRPYPGKHIHPAPDASSCSLAPTQEQLLALVLNGGDVVPCGHSLHISPSLPPENVLPAHGAQALVEFVRPYPGKHTHSCDNESSCSCAPAQVQLSAFVLRAGDVKPAAQAMQSSVLEFAS